MTKLRESTSANQQGGILGYCSSDKTHILTWVSLMKVIDI